MSLVIRSTLGKQCRIQIVFICCHTMSYTNVVYLLPYVFLFYDKETKTLLYIIVYKKHKCSKHNFNRSSTLTLKKNDLGCKSNI